VYRHHPRVFPTENKQSDIDPETACCIIDKTCDTYYQYRPSPTCIDYTPPKCGE
jgi:hypothetical protein